MSSLVSGRKMIGNKFFIWLANSMPYGFSHTVWDYFSNKTAMCYSNFPGPRKPFNFGEVKGYTLAPFTPIIGELTNGIAAVSIGNTLSIGMMTDLGYIEHPDEFMQILN